MPRDVMHTLYSFIVFCAAYAVMRCPSVCLSVRHVNYVKTSKSNAGTVGENCDFRRLSNYLATVWARCPL